jgi:secreted trypsin-like serine protease
MRYVVAAISLAVVPALALADERTGVEGKHFTPAASPVIGGAPAPAGKWPDAAGVNFGQDTLCSGTLIAPTVVLTAGHCVSPPPAPDSVLLGATTFAQSSQGETIHVIKSIEYPSSQSSEDLAVLVLEHAAKEAPRAIASGWARVDIKNNAAVQFVGFGTTDKNGSDNNTLLMEAQSTITDFDCSANLGNGCNLAAMPNGELGAGGGGIDTCPGDSGGPMYLLTGYGTFLAGVTSRGYDNDQFACSEGGIYERPDKVVDWIEEVAGVPVARGPEPTADPIAGVRGTGVETVITPNDPVDTKHSYEITTPPGHARAAVRSDGTVRACLDEGVAGKDKLVVTVSDKNNPDRKVAMTIPITIEDGDPGSDCDPNAFGGDSGGCCDSGRSSGGSIPLTLVVLLVLRRRR